MDYIKNQFATYEIALAVKELGFDDNCLAYYNPVVDLTMSKPILKLLDNDLIKFKEVDYPCVKAPLWQQVIDWFDQYYDLNINLYKLGNKYVFSISVPYHSEIEGFGVEYFYEDSYHRTMDAILKAIELCKNT